MISDAMKPAGGEVRSLRLFLLSTSLVAALCITSGFLGIAFYNRELIREEMHQNASNNFSNIVHMRRWNANHGGVYVEKRPGVESNPYLENPDITAVDGKVYTKKNPALMTREISEMLQKDEGFSFHITSLRPLNPNNAPDERERAALTAFEQGVREATWEEELGGVAHYRYMAPLMVEASCLACHAKQGYRVGDVRGGISISFRLTEVQEKLQRNAMIVLALAALTIALVIVSFGLFFRKLVQKLSEARAALNRMATTDALTGLANRHALFRRLDEEYERQGRSGAPLSVAMFDVDQFKSVNDVYGHLAGDAVLRDIAWHIQAGVRKYDLAARFGGEEFLLALPGADLPTAQRTAERIRRVVEEQVRAGAGDARRRITVSAGVARLRPGEEAAALINRADTALYRAKAEGRNRVVADAP
jgi:diguanylate cyclase (GGDEF)-like protein